MAYSKLTVPVGPLTDGTDDEPTVGTVGDRVTAAILDSDHNVPARSRDAGATEGADIQVSHVMNALDYFKLDREKPIWGTVELTGATGTYTMQEYEAIIRCNRSVALTITLRPAADGDGRMVTIRSIQASVVVIDGNAAETINGAASIILSNGQFVTLISDGSNWRIIAEDPAKLAAYTGRNVIINGSMRFDQRGSDISPVTGNDYGPDRWRKFESVTGATFTIERTSDAPDGFEFSMLITNTGNATAGAAEIAQFSQIVEGFNALRFGFGQSWAKKLALSFWVKGNNTGTYCAAFRNAADDRHYIVEYTIDAINTWEYKTITLTADIVGTWLTNNGIGLRVDFDLGSGTDRNNTADVWAAGLDNNTINQFDWIGTASATLNITGIQLELGNVATDFEWLDYETEFAMCQRYYRLTAPGVGAWINAQTQFYYQQHFDPPMRPTPSLTFLVSKNAARPGVGTFASSAVSSPASNADGAAILVTTAATGVMDTGGYMESGTGFFEAEL